MTKSQFWNVCRQIQQWFQGSGDFDSVLGGVCEAVGSRVQPCFLWTRGQRDMQIIAETLGGR